MASNTDIFTPTEAVITPEAMLAHWQGHRRLTRKVIDAFPEKELFSYSVGGMRPFAELALEMMDMAAPGIVGLATGKWTLAKDMPHISGKGAPTTKAALLQQWDEITEQINRIWPEIPAQRFQEKDTAFGQWENYNYDTLLYFIDNEIHHRGQGTVYLRTLGIEPPAFYNRD